MEREQRRALLGSLGLDLDLLAVDPVGCGCTECLIGEYIPSDRIPSEQIPIFQNLVRQGVLRDNTEGWFMIGAEGSGDETYTREDLEKAFNVGRSSAFCWTFDAWMREGMPES